MNSQAELVRWVDYRRSATERLAVDGKAALKDLSRVRAETTDQDDGEAVHAELLFFEDEQRRARFSGRIHGVLALRCQRCLDVFSYRLSADIAGVVVANDAAAASVPKADEPVLADGDMLDVYALVSDELLLAMPTIARCEREACQRQYVFEPAQTRAEDNEKPKNPFTVLKTLKTDD